MIGRFLVEKKSWIAFQVNARNFGFMSASDCLRAQVRDVNRMSGAKNVD